MVCISSMIQILSIIQKSCTGKETALIATQHENGRLKRHLDHLNGEMNQLKEEIDWLKREKGQLEGRNSQLDSHLRRLQVCIHDVILLETRTELLPNI